MKLRYLYFGFCLLGLLLPYSQFIPWLWEHHALNMSLFVRDLFANRISGFFALDVIVSAIVLICFIQTEGRRLRVRLLGCRLALSCLLAFRLDCHYFFTCGSSSWIEPRNSERHCDR
jgi:hypothetical protein